MFLSDVLPTAWQGVAYADVPPGGSLAVLGLGPIGDMATRVAQHQGGSGSSAWTWFPSGWIGPESTEWRPSTSPRATSWVGSVSGPGTGPRRGDRCGGHEAHGSPVGKLAQQMAGLLPDGARPS